MTKREARDDKLFMEPTFVAVVAIVADVAVVSNISNVSLVAIVIDNRV